MSEKIKNEIDKKTDEAAMKWVSILLYFALDKNKLKKNDKPRKD